MSYTEREQSDYAAQPLELYRFAMGARLWLYTSADHEVTYGEDVYQPCYIKRGGFTKGGDARKSTLSVEMAATNPLALLYRTGWVQSPMILTIYRHHYGDADFSVLWKGRITNCKWAGSVASLSSESVFTLFKRAGLRRVYQVGCPHVLFGAACGLSAASWAVAATVTSIGSGQVAVSGISGYGSGYFLGGMIQAGEELRMITAHAEDVLTLVDSITGVSVGDVVTLWPGCSRTVTACTSKFGNLDNYGGLPYLPTKNPFSGDALV